MVKTLLKKVKDSNTEWINASLTIETALVLPLFMFGMLSILSVLGITLTLLRFQNALNLTAENMSIVGCNGNVKAISEIKEEVMDCFSWNKWKAAPVSEKEDGPDMSKSSLTDSEYFEIVANYNVTPFIIGEYIKIPIEQRAFLHTWVGYNKPYAGWDDSEYVYITDNATVYHLDRECSHLRLKIRMTTSSQVKSLRNKAGGKYKQCKVCNSTTKDKILYVTEDGECFHNSLSCSGLKRSVHAVKKSSVKNLPPCSRCGK